MKISSDSSTSLNTATYITLQAKLSGSELSEFLSNGAGIVKATEPNTTLWYALEGDDNQYGIFDVFPDRVGRAEHFDGKVANALYESAGKLVEGGWEQGVLANVANYEVLSSKVPNPNLKATEATYIEIVAKPGKEGALRDLLTKAADLVKLTEPKTVYWTGLQLDAKTFAIFDTFTDASGRAEHFAGQVAATLQGLADEIVEGGWEQGVVAKVKNYRIIAESSQLV